MDRQTELQLEFREASPPLERHTVRSWRGVSVQYSRLRLPAEYEFRWDGNCHYLAHHDLVLLDGEMEVLGERPVIGRDLRDEMTYLPAGQSITGWAKPADRLNAFTVVCFDPASIQDELEMEFSGIEPRPHIYFKDAELGATMRKLSRLMAEEERSVSKIYAETLGLTAALEMFRILSAEPLSRKSVEPGALSKAQRELAYNYIEENLSRDVGLDEFASVCGLTRFHFSRAFKATFGEPPYQYILRRRIERAQHLLANSRVPIAEVAIACGFKGASQFARSFRSALGQAPLTYRRGV